MIRREDVESQLNGSILLQVVVCVIGAIVVTPWIILLPVLSIGMYIDLERKMNKLEKQQ